MKPITSPEGYRLFWTCWTLGVIALVSILAYWLGPIIIARGLARWTSYWLEPMVVARSLSRWGNQ